jgi:hypothetical protein
MQYLLMSAKSVGAAILLGGVALAAPAIDIPAEEVTKPEKEGLVRIHRTAVEVFVGRSGLGIERMPLPPLDSVLTPKSLAESGSEVKRFEEKLIRKEIRHVALEKFSALGMRGRFPTADKKEQWVVREVLLIGLIKNPEPVVYLEGQVPSEKEMPKETGREATPKKKELKTRKLDKFENESIKVIQGGGELQAERRGQTMRAVSAIYAGQPCLKCHEHEGQMLGAFTYRLERVALKPEEVGK